MLTTSVSATEQMRQARVELIPQWWRRFNAFLFKPDSDAWLSLFRIGLGLEIVLYSISLRADWGRMFSRSNTGFLNREFSEAILSIQNPWVPRLGWLVTIGERLGMNEQTTLALLWFLFFGAGCFLIAGFFSRSAAILSWLLHLCLSKSGEYLAYGIDNFITIGLFYLMIAPLPDALALDRKFSKKRSADPATIGFFRRVLQFHVCVIYFFGGITKCLGAGWWNGDSMWRALIRPPFDLIANQTLLHWQPLLMVGGVAVCLFETTFPILIWSKRTRAFCLFAIIAMHIGIAVTMGLYLFSLIMIVLDLAAFAPGTFRWPFQRESHRPNSENVDAAI